LPRHEVRKLLGPMSVPEPDNAFSVVIAPSAWTELSVISIDDFRTIERALRVAAARVSGLELTPAATLMYETLRVGDFTARLEIDPAERSLVLTALERA
jgi:hypothetical protein